MRAFKRMSVLLGLLDEAFDARAWHGTNLRGSVRRVDAERAAWRPGPKRHNIWEIAVHTAYWKYAVRRRITGEKRGSFPLEGSDWFERPTETTAGAWRSDVGLLVDEHVKLRAVVAALDDRTLTRKSPGSRYSTEALVRGAAAHDLYHAGQIQLLKRLAPPR
jgi:uncharacterized damage-inducible protein DinB